MQSEGYDSKGYILQNDARSSDAEASAIDKQTIGSSFLPDRLRHQCGRFLNHQVTQNSVIALIFFNSILMGVETFSFVQDNSRILHTFEALDSICLSLFTVEIGMELIYREWQLFRAPWLVFDLLIVAVSWMSHSFDVGRAFRIMRVLLIVDKIRDLKELVRALGTCVPKIFAVGIFLILILYVYGVIFTSLFQDLYADGYLDEPYFSRLDYTMFTLFQMMTMDNWSAITKQVMAVYPLAWIPFILYILTTTFLVLNLAVGVIGSAVAGAYEEIESHVMEVSSSIGERNEDSIRTLERKVDKLTFLIENMAQQQNGTEDSDFNSFEEEIQTREQTGDTF